ncbi:FHA domain-containing protein FhaB/FipA [Aeriscardovia aeriphila]|uniref:FHA domain-containing protein n=1 Tax=Aeriscardovia aeriphila TaxID=218139 RepID=A0A261F7Z0_9BIFI|nr:hypothetical protein [Aeriscardovia aeriphila]OZG55261.1 FHA domain-containing protein [Aeriscardovia aeriphila]
MTELTFAILKYGFLIALWIFVWLAVRSLHRDVTEGLERKQRSRRRAVPVMPAQAPLRPTPASPLDAMNAAAAPVAGEPVAPVAGSSLASEPVAPMAGGGPLTPGTPEPLLGDSYSANPELSELSVGKSAAQQPSPLASQPGNEPVSQPGAQDYQSGESEPAATSQFPLTPSAGATSQTGATNPASASNPTANPSADPADSLDSPALHHAIPQPFGRTPMPPAPAPASASNEAGTGSPTTPSPAAGSPASAQAAASGAAGDINSLAHLVSATTTKETARSAMPSQAATMLVIIDGPHAGATFPLDQGNITLGRSTHNTIVLDDEYVSGHHARVCQDPQSGQWVVEDLGSTNGTYINESRMPGRAVLRPRVPVRIGATTFELR